MRKTQMLLNKTLYLGLSKLEISEIVTYQFWYDYVKPKYGEKPKIYYMGTDSCIIYIKLEDTYIAKDIGTRFDTSNYELDRPLTKGKN